MRRLIRLKMGRCNYFLNTSDGVADETRLRLKIYRALGIELVEDDMGNYSKAVIRKWEVEERI